VTDDLSPAELEALTGHKKVERQAAALAKLRIPFRHGGGRLFVDRKVAQHWPQWQQTRGEVRLELVR
jgi:hypothetical protein